jgi:signal transduction histidine kinase
MDLPLLLAAGFLLGPFLGGFIAFVGAGDIREFKRELAMSHALFNRAQIALSTMAAAAVFQAAAGTEDHLALLIPAALLALLADTIVNFVLVGLAGGALVGIPWLSFIRRMRVGRRREFIFIYSCFGLLGLLLSRIYLEMGPWGLVAFVLPLILARQAFAHAQEVEEKERALEQITQHIAEERRDERVRIASSLHDDVLQGLHYVTLHAQVIREDLRTGRLLQLDEDIPGLLAASESAGEALRNVISDLRRSPFGRGGLKGTLSLLIEHLRDETSLRIEASIEDTQAQPHSQLLAYQVAKEALVNALRHSRAHVVQLSIKDVEDHVVVVVADDGRGFDPFNVDQERHFGLALMKEKVEGARGALVVDSGQPGGTVVTARIPLARFEDSNKQPTST